MTSDLSNHLGSFVRMLLKSRTRNGERGTGVWEECSAVIRIKFKVEVENTEKGSEHQLWARAL